MTGDGLHVEVEHAVARVTKHVTVHSHANLARYLIHQRHPVGVANHILHKHKHRRRRIDRLLDRVDRPLLEKVDPIADDSDRVPGLEVERFFAQRAERVVED